MRLLGVGDAQETRSQKCWIGVERPERGQTRRDVAVQRSQDERRTFANARTRERRRAGRVGLVVAFGKRRFRVRLVHAQALDDGQSFGRARVAVRPEPRARAEPPALQQVRAQRFRGAFRKLESDVLTSVRHGPRRERRGERVRHPRAGRRVYERVVAKKRRRRERRGTRRDARDWFRRLTVFFVRFVRSGDRRVETRGQHRPDARLFQRGDRPPRQRRGALRGGHHRRAERRQPPRSGAGIFSFVGGGVDYRDQGPPPERVQVRGVRARLAELAPQKRERLHARVAFVVRTAARRAVVGFGVGSARSPRDGRRDGDDSGSQVRVRALPDRGKHARHEARECRRVVHSSQVQKARVR